MPKKGRQVERLEPQFLKLEEALDRKLAALKGDAEGVTPEQVLVFEVIGSVGAFFELVERTEGLQWLADEFADDIEPDQDFYHPGKEHRPIRGYLYFTMSDQRALKQLLSLWTQWKHRRLPETHRAWQEVFRQLHTIRPWDIEDRLRETGIREDWEERKQQGDDKVIAELGLWCWPSAAKRAKAEERVRTLVSRAGGQTMASYAVPEIAYHGVLAEFPIAAADDILARGDIDIARCDDVYVFRPAGQAIRGFDGVPVQEEVSPRPTPTGEPVVGLLDGLPMENHALLTGGLSVEDPEQWSEQYPAVARQHGTAMASLILRGDMNEPEEPLQRKLYVTPIFQAIQTVNGWTEKSPSDRLWTDVIHRAVRRAVVGHGEAEPTAPGVVVFNLSVGYGGQPFVRSPRSLARLLDWLSWQHKVLFVVSAGNHDDAMFELTDDELTDDATERAVLRRLYDRRRMHRLLPPAESINALTVGALHHDEGERWGSPAGADDRRLLVHTAGLPAPYSALGQGFRRAVKPDVLAPGGRAVYRRGLAPPRAFEFLRSNRSPPGQKVAAPGRAGETRGTWFTCGTSNAAALVTRLAAQIHDPIHEVVGGRFKDVPMAVWLKALLVHTARWPGDAFRMMKNALKTDENTRRFRDEATAFLGYGALDPRHASECSRNRVTLLGGGTIAADETWTHRVPIPESLHRFTKRRRLTVTLAWFTPINPRHQKYRQAALSFELPEHSVSWLGVKSGEAHAKATRRGTVQHQVLEGSPVIDPENEEMILEIPVTCSAEAGQLEHRVPYALACTLEIETDLFLDIYTEIRERIQIPTPIAVR